MQDSGGESKSGSRHITKTNEVEENASSQQSKQTVQRQFKNYFSGVGAGVLSSVV
jgi:hypothetical protein